MQGQVQKLAAGIIDYELPMAALSVEALETELVEGEIFSGSFAIESSNGISMRGTARSSNSRIHILTESFSGAKAEIFYAISAEGLKEGDFITGEVYIICSHKEFVLSVSGIVTRHYFDSSLGKIKSLSRFFELATKSYDEALKIFLSDNFANLFHDDDIHERMIYEGLRGDNPVNAELYDEFLFACNIKERCKVFLKVNEGVFQHVNSDSRERFLLKKDGYGSFTVRISSDSDFIDIEKEIITASDFVGNQCEVFFFIRYDMLHGGKNPGRIFVQYEDETFEYHLTVTKGSIDGEKILTAQKELRCLYRGLSELYLDFRMNEIPLSTWASGSIERLDKIIFLKPGDLWPMMYKALVLIINAQREDADWLISDIRRRIDEQSDDKKAFFMYLTSLQNSTDIKELIDEVRRIYRENSDNDRVLWALLFMDEEFERSKSRKFNEIKKNVLSKRPSCFIYFEAYYIISQDSYLLSELGRFEINLVKWAIRHNGLTHGIAAQFARLSSQIKVFAEDIFDILCKICEKYPEKDIVSALLSYIIKCGKFGRPYASWYKLGLDMDIRLAGMYENYIMSIDEINNDTVSKELLLYFQYNTRIETEIKEALIALVVKNKDIEPTIYVNYLPVIDTFVIEQLKNHAVNTNLKVIYEDFIERNGFSKITADDFCEIIFARNLILEKKNCEGRLIVVQEQLKEEKCLTLKDGKATAVIFSPEFIVVHEDNHGRRRIATDEVTTEPLFADYKYRSALWELSPNNLNLLLHYFANISAYPVYDDARAGRIYSVLVNETVRDDYKSALLPELFKESFDYSGDFFEKLYNTLDLSILRPKEMGRIIEECIRQGMTDTAYMLIKQYGYENVISSKIVILCSSIISEKGYDTEDEYLTQLCFCAFRENLYTEESLIYLARYYKGSTKNLQRIWLAAKGFDLVVFELEERILWQMLTTDEYLSKADDIFVSYAASGGSYMLKHAYYSHASFGYILKGLDLSNGVYEKIKDEYLSNDELMDICKIALLRATIENSNKTPDDLKIEEELLGYFVERNMKFSFFEKADNIFKGKYRIQDRMYMQFIGRPEETPVIHYRFDAIMDDYENVSMRHMMYGIFVTDITVFAGESVQYYVTLGEGEDEEVMTSGCIERSDVYSGPGMTRFERINNMYVSSVLGNRQSAESYLKEYIELEALTENSFKVL